MIASSPEAQETYERQNEIRAPHEPQITVRAKTQIVSNGVVRYMGEVWRLPLREGLGQVGQGEVEEVVELTRPLTWTQNAPGPLENYDLPGDFAVMGSREGGTEKRGGRPGDQERRQTHGAFVTTSLQPQQYDTYRPEGQGGMTPSTGQWWREGATGATSGARGATPAVLPEPRNQSRRPEPPHRRRREEGQYPQEQAPEQQGDVGYQQ